MANISKVKLPSGNVYDIVDAGARTLIEALSGSTAFLGLTTTALTDGATTSPITIDSSNVTPTKGNIVVYNNAEFIWDGAKWIEFGDLSRLGTLASKNTVTLNKGTSTNVLGSGTTASAASSAVTFSGGTSDKVLGADTTFAVTQPTISVTPSTTNIKATASGTTVGANGTANAVTGYASPVTDKVLGSDATFTTTVTPSTTYIKATASGTAVGASGTETFVKSYPGATSKLATTTVPNVTSVGTADTWSFAMGSGTDAETLIISGTNGTVPTLGTAKTVATGSLSTSGSGGTVMTGLGTATTGSAITGVSVTTQPTIALATESSSATGRVQVATGISSATTTTDTKDEVTAITGLGSPTTSACLTGVKVTAQPTIALATGATSGTGVVSVATGISSATATGAAVSANSDDEVTAVTGVGNGTAAAQTITITPSNVGVAKYSDLSVSVS